MRMPNIRVNEGESHQFQSGLAKPTARLKGRYRCFQIEHVIDRLMDKDQRREDGEDGGMTIEKKGGAHDLDIASTITGTGKRRKAIFQATGCP